MKTLVVYYSFFGNNEKLAKCLKVKLNCDILKIEEKKKRKMSTIIFDLILGRKPKLVDYTVKVGEYDYIVMAMPIWCGSIASPMRTFIAKEKDNIKKYSCISFCGGSDWQQKRIESKLAKIVKKPPVEFRQVVINKFLTEEELKDVKKVMGFRLTDENMNVIEKDIDSFIQNIK